MQLEKVFELEDLSRNAGSSDRCIQLLLLKNLKGHHLIVRGKKAKRISLEQVKVRALVYFKGVCFKLCLTLVFF